MNKVFPSTVWVSSLLFLCFCSLSLALSLFLIIFKILIFEASRGMKILKNKWEKKAWVCKRGKVVWELLGSCFQEQAFSLLEKSLGRGIEQHERNINSVVKFWKNGTYRVPRKDWNPPLRSGQTSLNFSDKRLTLLQPFKRIKLKHDHRPGTIQDDGMVGYFASDSMGGRQVQVYLALLLSSNSYVNINLINQLIPNE